MRLRLNGDGSRIDVRDGGSHVTTVNTRTFAVGDPAPASAPRAPASPDDGGGFPWLLLALGGAAAAAALYAIRMRAAPRAN